MKNLIFLFALCFTLSLSASVSPPDLPDIGKTELHGSFESLSLQSTLDPSTARMVVFLTIQTQLQMSYCTDPYVDYVPSDESCGPSTQKGGIRDLVLFLTELPDDPEDATEIQALIDSGDAMYIPDVKVGISEPSPQEVARMRSCSPATVVNYDREFTLMDDDVSPVNVQAYNSINASKGVELLGILMHECGAQRATYIEERISLQGGRIVPDDDTETLQHFNFIGKWKSPSDSPIVSWPSGLVPRQV